MVLIVFLVLILIILFYIIYKAKKEIETLKEINNKLNIDKSKLMNIDKFQIDFLKNGYEDREYKGKILVGDYDKFSIFNTINVLKELEYDYDLVKSAEDMLYKLKSNKYDYIITNYIYEKGIDGIELCNIIKNDLSINTPIIILSGSTDMKNIFIKSADYYIEKPLTKLKLKKIVK